MGPLADHAEVLGPQTTAVWPVVAEIVPDGTILMGGTALALHLAHRRSEDLDLFAPHEFDPDPLHESLDRFGNFVLSRKSLGHLHGTFAGVKIDILWNAGALTLKQPTVIAGLGYFGDVEDDPVLRSMVGDDVRDRVVNYFESRHPTIVQAFTQTTSPDL